MTLPVIQQPYGSYLGLDGAALNGGKLYIGVVNLDPQTNPQACYWDEAGTILASQPITIQGGFTMRAGAPARVYTRGPFSARVRTSADALVWYEADAGPMVDIPQIAYDATGVVADNPASAGANGEAINSLMATIAAAGGGYLYLPAGSVWTDRTIDNKYCNVWVCGASKIETSNAGALPANFAGTKIVPTFAGTVLKHRTPYSGTSGQYFGGGFVNLAVYGNSIAPRLLEVDSILSGTYDLYLYEAVGSICANFISGVSGVDLAECRGVQNTRINLRIVQDGQSGAAAAASCIGVAFDGSSNANFSFNADIELDIVHKNGTAAYFSCADNNLIRKLRTFRVSGGSGVGLLMGGRSSAKNNVGGEANLFGIVSCNAPIQIGGAGTGGSGTVFNRILSLDTDNNPANSPATLDANGLWYWDDTTGGGSWAWNSWTPTLTADTGAFTSIAAITARWSRTGKTVAFNITIQVTAVGTASGAIRFTLPTSPANSFVAAATDTVVGNVLRAFYWGGYVRITKYDGTNPIAAGDFYVVTGSYETT